MIKIKLTIPGTSSKINASQFLGNDRNTYKDCEFFINENVSDPDYWFIIEQPNNEISTYIDPSRVFWGAAEVSRPVDYYLSSNAISYLKQFSKVFTCFNSFSENSVYSLPFLPWMINSNHGTSIFASSERDYNYFTKITNIPKEKKISVICSSKAHTPEHAQRLEFLKIIKTHFKDKIDWFGNGIIPLDEKWNGIAPYKYHLVIENHFRYNIITEKLLDAYLGLSYPIYYGAPNVREYFPPDALTTLNINDLKESIKIIESVIEEDIYDNKFQNLLKAKDLCINKYNLFHRIAEICMEDYRKKSCANNKTTVRINKVKTSFKHKLLTKLNLHATRLLGK